MISLRRRADGKDFAPLSVLYPPPHKIQLSFVENKIHKFANLWWFNCKFSCGSLFDYHIQPLNDFGCNSFILTFTELVFYKINIIV